MKTWYVARILKKDSTCNKSKPSSGKLISKWCNSVTESRKLQKKINKENQNVNSPQETGVFMKIILLIVFYQHCFTKLLQLNYFN